MQQHYENKVTEYEANVTKGFMTLRPNNYFIPLGESPRNFRFPADVKFLIKGALFSGFKRCLSLSQRFQSDTERRFAVLLEDQSDPSIVKWLKPGKGVFQIHYKGDTPYEPDFVVETKTAKLICEIKRVKDINTREVQDKANAAVKWCECATAHEKQNGGKPWAYLLIPDDAVKDRLAWAVWRTRMKIESPKKFDELFG
jgi:type III restriction enzyme